jgi:hypothetical protein
MSNALPVKRSVATNAAAGYTGGNKKMEPFEKKNSIINAPESKAKLFGLLYSCK